MSKGRQKSAGTWAQSLFRRSGNSLGTSQYKTFFAHRYPHEYTAPEYTPFSALFSVIGEGKPNRKGKIPDSKEGMDRNLFFLPRQIKQKVKQD